VKENFWGVILEVRKGGGRRKGGKLGAKLKVKSYETTAKRKIGKSKANLKRSEIVDENVVLWVPR